MTSEQTLSTFMKVWTFWKRCVSDARNANRYPTSTPYPRRERTRSLMVILGIAKCVTVPVNALVVTGFAASRKQHRCVRLAQGVRPKRRPPSSAPRRFIETGLSFGVDRVSVLTVKNGLPGEVANVRPSGTRTITEGTGMPYENVVGNGTTLYVYRRFKHTGVEKCPAVSVVERQN